ncbi:MAG: MFS transporter, partial [Tannerellaceae bacterium]|nr:MFS transporter [Tannerellaceae bacterium]
VGVEVGIPGTLNLFLTDLTKGMSMDPTIAGFVAGTYWFLMLIGRLIGSAIGGKVSSKILLAAGSGIGLALVLAAILSPTNTMVTMPVLKTGATGGLSFGAELVPISAMFLVLVGLCTSIMWGGIFNLAVEGLGKYLAAATGIFMVLVCGGGLLPLLQNWVADISTFMTSYWVVFAGLAYLLFYALVGSKNVNKDIQV